jgi:hypothetical protein
MNPRTTRLPQDRIAAFWSLLQLALFLGTMIVLGQAIGWPGILREPAGTILATIAAHPIGTLAGYWLYLADAIALIPLVLAVHRSLHTAGAGGIANDTFAVLGLSAALLKSLGIVRWLAAAPDLAQAYVDPAATDATRTLIEFTFRGLNGYAGSVGELLGVQIAFGLWIAGTALTLFRIGYRPLGGLGLVAGGLLVATATRTFVPAAAGLQSIAVPLALAWFPWMAWRFAAAPQPQP